MGDGSRASAAATREAVGSEPVEHVSDGWVLRCGCLYLHVECSDGVTRTYIVNRGKKHAGTDCRNYHGGGN